MTPMFLAPLLFVGCDNDFEFPGITTWNMFPFEQGRVWEYISTDRTLTYKLVAQLEGKPDIEQSINIYTVSYNRECVSNDPDCEDAELFRLRWSSTANLGVRIHTLQQDGINTQFEPPLVVARPQMELDEMVMTTTGGRSWTSQFGGIVPCDTNFPAGWDQCGLFEIDDNLIDVPSPILGAFWAAPQQGLATIEFQGEEGRWRLSDVDCGECDGRW